VAERAKELYSIDSLDAFQKIYGVGPAKATELVEKGIRTIADLRSRVKDEPALLNDKQHIGLRYYEDLLERIPRAEMEQHDAMLRGSLPPAMADMESHLVGSFRRGAPTSGDIDLLIRIPDASQGKRLLADYVERMQKTRYIEEVLAIGEHKCMAICRLSPNEKARRLDILLAPTEEYVYSLFYFTGSDQFNVAVRQFCLTEGYTLNEHRLTPLHATTTKPPSMETEEDLFSFLCLRWVDPTERINGQQVEVMDL
jgi:DNA polymerase beta